MMRRIGLVLLWGGFLVGAFVSVRHTTSIEWPLYVAAAVVGVVGVVILRRESAAAGAEATRVQRALVVMRDRLRTIGDELAALRETPPGVYEVKDVIDAKLAVALGEFADAREAMIPAFGLEAYADVMTAFAGAERLINRAWSASADGYAVEVETCLERADDSMRRAIERFRAADARAGNDASPASDADDAQDAEPAGGAKGSAAAEDSAPA